MMIAVVVAALLALGWPWTAPQAAQDGALTPPKSAASPQTVKTFHVEIENTKPGVATPVLKATQGDSLTIDITSDRPGTLEIHGYQRKIDVAPGSVATLSFVANIAGRFPVDLHARDGRHLDVTALEVQPR